MIIFFWMKLTEIASYWAAKEYTSIELLGAKIRFRAPFATPWFTVRIPLRIQNPRLFAGNDIRELKEVNSPLSLDTNSFFYEGEATVICFDLSKGESYLMV